MILCAIALSLSLAAGCASTRDAPDRPPLVTAALDTLDEEGALEPRQLEPLARTLASLARPLDAREASLARAVARGLAERIAKRREWGASPSAQAEDLLLAARAVALAPERLDAADLAPIAQEVLAQRDPRGVEPFVVRWTELGLPRTAAASDAIVRALSGRFPLEGLLEALFARGFRLEDAALRAYAERALEDRYDARDLLFVLERTSAPEVAARLPAFAERLLAWVSGCPEGEPRDGPFARRIFHNAILALAAADQAGVPLPASLFEAHLRAAAGRADLAVDDQAAAYALYARRTDDLLERRLDLLLRSRAVPEAQAELIQVAALLQELEHPRAEDALLVARRLLERPAGLDEPIGARTPPRRYDTDEVHRLLERITPALASAHRGRLYLDLVTSLAREQGEPAIAARLEGVRLVRR